jgi:hypothetical protein
MIKTALSGFLISLDLFLYFLLNVILGGRKKEYCALAQ